MAKADFSFVPYAFTFEFKKTYSNSSNINLFQCGVMPLLDGCLGQQNWFYSIGVFGVVLAGQEQVSAGRTN